MGICVRGSTGQAKLVPCAAQSSASSDCEGWETVPQPPKRTRVSTATVLAAAAAASVARIHVAAAAGSTMAKRRRIFGDERIQFHTISPFFSRCDKEFESLIMNYDTIPVKSTDLSVCG